MSSNRRLGGAQQWAIAATSAGLGVLVTLLITNAVNHAGWSPYGVAVGWIFIVSVATLIIKLRHTSLDGLRQRGAAGNPVGGDGINSGGDGG